MSTIIRNSADILYINEDAIVANGATLPFYGSVKDADNYFQYRLGAQSWDEATRKEKIAALAQSTRAIDRLSFIGEKTGTLEFPRDFQEVVPVDIVQACYENALSLLDGVDPDTETNNLMATSRGYGNMRTTFDRGSLAPHTVHGIASPTAWRLLKPFLTDANAMRLARV